MTPLILARVTGRIAGLLALVAWVALPASGAAAPGPVGFRGASGLSVYSDNDGVTVLSPWAEASQRVLGPVTLSAGWDADIISGASVDVITAATSAFDEERNEIRASALLDLDWIRASLGYTFSIESDTRTHLLSASGEIDLLSRSLTLGLGYALGLDRLGTVNEPSELWRDRVTHRIDLSAAYVLGPGTLASAVYTFQLMSGFLASPYRQVPLFPRSSALQTRDRAQWVDERHPELRGRHALTLRLRQAVGSRVFLRASYRGYLDTWSMRASTGEIAAAVDLGPGFIVELSERLHWQSSVSFYRSVYTVNRDFLTRDRRLAKMLRNIAALTLRLHLAPFEALATGEVQWTRYDDFRTVDDAGLGRYPDVLGFVFQLGLALEL